jgi:hypothetical protein
MFTLWNACPLVPCNGRRAKHIPPGLAPWNSFSACLLAKNARIGRARLDLVNQGHAIPPGFGDSLRKYPIKLHHLKKRVELFYFELRTVSYGPFN